MRCPPGAHDDHVDAARFGAEHLALWQAAFPGRYRVALTAADIEQVLRGWQRDGLAPATLDKRRQALYQVYAVLDRGRGLANPVAAVSTFTVPAPEPRALPYRVIRRVLAQVADPWRARLELMAFAGLRPEEVRRVQPGDWSRPQMRVRTAKDGRQATIPLLPEAQDALRRLSRGGALGPFSGTLLAKHLRAACEACRVAPFRPYDLRHSFGPP